MTRTRVRRRRLTLTVSLALVAAAWAGPAVRALGSPERPTRIARSSYVVREGDTLWSIARQVRPAADPRATIAEIERTNVSVEAGGLVPGQSLLVPAG